MVFKTTVKNVFSVDMLTEDTGFRTWIKHAEQIPIYISICGKQLLCTANKIINNEINAFVMSRLYVLKSNAPKVFSLSSISSVQFPFVNRLKLFGFYSAE